MSQRMFSGGFVGLFVWVACFSAFVSAQEPRNNSADEPVIEKPRSKGSVLVLASGDMLRDDFSDSLRALRSSAPTGASSATPSMRSPTAVRS